MLLAKYRRGPMAPQIREVLKCVLEYGQLKPLTAVLVHTPAMWLNAQFRTPRDDRVPTIMPTTCTRNSFRCGIFGSSVMSQQMEQWVTDVAVSRELHVLCKV